MLFIYLLLGLGAILAGAVLFTNAVEWLGKKMDLSHGAVGSVLAAVGTALPETVVPIVAIVTGDGSAAGHDVGVGAILGAPFMLATLALFVSGLSAVLFRRGLAGGPVMYADGEILRRDLRFFLAVFPVALLASLVPAGPWRWAVAASLVVAYVHYVRLTLRSGEGMGEHELDALHLHRRAENPAMIAVVLQLLLALAVMVGGADFFVDGLIGLAEAVGIPVLILALIITPVATELPEKFNSVIWIRQGKDTLALGNITGAMVFQSSIIPAVGIALTPWALDSLTWVSSVLAILSGLLLYGIVANGRRFTARPLLWGGAFYGLFFLYVLLGGRAPGIGTH